MQGAARREYPAYCQGLQRSSGALRSLPKGAVPLGLWPRCAPWQWDAPFPAGRALPQAKGDALMRLYSCDTTLARISYQPSAAVAESLAVVGHAPLHPCTLAPLHPCTLSPSSRFDIVSTMPSASFRSCAPPQRRFNALATNAGEICGLAAMLRQYARTVTVRSCRYFGPEVAAARRSVRPVPDRACGSASVRANRVAMRFQCPTPFLTLATTPLRSASIAIWQALRTAPYRHDRTVTSHYPFRTCLSAPGRTMTWVRFVSTTLGATTPSRRTLAPYPSLEIGAPPC